MTDPSKPEDAVGQSKPEKKPGQGAARGNARKAATAAGASPDGGPRAATVASPIEHDGEIHATDDLILLTEAQFEALLPTGALVETAWDDCAEL